MKDGYIKVASATTEIKVADVEYNTKQIIGKIKEAQENGAKLVVFPELCITGYTCGDLFLQSVLLRGAEDSLAEIAKATCGLEILVCVGLPVMVGSSLYNCCGIIFCGEVLAIVPKTNIPNYTEFYESRYFASGKNIRKYINFAGSEVAFSTDIIIKSQDVEGFCVGFELCEDLWVCDSPSTKLALCGATIIANSSASNEIIGKASYRRNLVSMQSAKTLSAYIYSDAGIGESSTDMVYGGHNIICENGTVLGESKLFQTGITYADIDVARLLHERRRTTTFQNIDGEMAEMLEINIPFTPEKTNIKREISKTPFVPKDDAELENRCEEILALQANGLATRLRHIGGKICVIGLSGGLDSALALVVCARAYEILGLDTKGIICVTMPCFGTTKRTKNNAITLSQAYGTTLMEIDIASSVQKHFQDIGCDESARDITYENAQARERTQILMDLANKNGGLVVGTGDLSELALGWATYNGDHMSMYAVNSSIPKTLVRYLIMHEAKMNCGLSAVLEDVLDTPVSPELLPPKDGEISQKTEELVGPYILHDFFLYHMLRFGFPPKKIFRMAKIAFAGEFDGETIKKWLVIFFKRFFSQQFKRSCLPDGPKVGTVSLSPRGDWRMPSDACGKLWICESEEIVAK